jgi:hypothetical protein
MGAGYGAVTGQNIGQSALTGGLTAGALSYAKGAGATGFGPEGQGNIFSRNAPAPVTDNSAPLMPNEGIKTLSSGQTNLTNSVPNQVAPGDMDIGFGPGRYSPPAGTNLAGSTSPLPGPTSPLPSSTSPTPTGADMDIGFGPGRFNPGASASAAPTGATTDIGFGPGKFTPDLTPAAPTQAASSGPMDYLTKTKNDLFSSNPKDPGFFYTDKGNISIPAVVGTTLAGGYLSGGFNQTPVAPPGIIDRNVSGQTLVNQNPGQYIVGGLPGFNASTAFPSQPSITSSPTYTNQANIMYGRPTTPQYDPNTPIRFAAKGGISNIYPRKTGKINGPGTGTSDSIPAMLSDGEFVITAKAVRGAGNGSRREGAKKLYRMMHALEKKAGGKI